MPGSSGKCVSAPSNGSPIDTWGSGELRSKERGEGRGARASLDYAVHHVHRVHCVHIHLRRMRLGCASKLAPCKDATVSTENMLSGCGRYQRLTDYCAEANHEVRVVAFQGVGNMLIALADGQAWSALFGERRQA
jgi:hypothetical protein